MFIPGMHQFKGAKKFVPPTGGTISTGLNGKRLHQFNSSGTFNSGSATKVRLLIVGGGGSGGGNTNISGIGAGAGGAGEYIAIAEFDVTPFTDYAIVVGEGGDPVLADGNPGTDTTAFGYTARGGGYGGLPRSSNTSDGGDGGSGGGQGFGTGGSSPGSSTAVSPGLGNPGGTFDNKAGGGGGGAGSAGGDATGGTGGDAGDGVTNDITGTSIEYCKGGRGGDDSGNQTGADGVNPGDGGDGGGGGNANNILGGAGADGQVNILIL